MSTEVNVYKSTIIQNLKSHVNDVGVDIDLYYHFKQSKKPSILGALIALGGTAVLTVGVLSAAHALPGITSPAGYALLAGGSLTIIIGLSIIATDRILAHKHKKKYIVLVNQELQEILNGNTENGQGFLKQLEKLNTAVHNDEKSYFCHSSESGLEVLVLGDKSRIRVDAFNWDGTSGEKFFSQINKDGDFLSINKEGNNYIHHQ